MEGKTIPLRVEVLKLGRFPYLVLPIPDEVRRKNSGFIFKSTDERSCRAAIRVRDTESTFEIVYVFEKGDEKNG
jgi:hypothetical protein